MCALNGQDGKPTRSHVPVPQVGVVGAGPSGLYAARALVESDVRVGVDVFDRLPTPYGLVRYGVAPDNQKMKTVARVLSQPFEEGHDVRFIGNVTFGRDITRDELRRLYHAVIYATGSQAERRLGIPGDDLDRSYGAREFVNWYSGHPDAAQRTFRLVGAAVVVVGAGNVALDVARMLAKRPDRIAETDVADEVLKTFRDSRITDIHMLSRRGPAQAKYTSTELREMGELSDVDIVVDPAEIRLTPEDEEAVAADRQLRKNIDLLREWSQRPLSGKSRRVHMKFWRSPVEIRGSGGVEQVVAERTVPSQDGTVSSSGDFETIDAHMVIAAVGYRTTPLPDVAFDESTATVPNKAGRVLRADGTPEHGEYVTGWAKRGPLGVIGTNKSDAAETVNCLVDDLMRGKLNADWVNPTKDEIPCLLEQRSVQHVAWADWLRLDAHEVRAGEQQRRPRVKVPEFSAMLRLSKGAGQGATEAPGKFVSTGPSRTGRGTDVE